MHSVLIYTSVIAAIFLLDRLGLWMEKKGWLYYRHKKPSSGAGNALQELNAFLNPSIKHVMEIKQKDSKQRDDQGEGKKRTFVSGDVIT